MRVRDLNIGEQFKQLLEEYGVGELYPPQEDSVSAGILDGKNIILCTPTASGKTLAAELAMIKALEAKKRVVYVVPLIALAYEKYEEFRKYEKLGFSVRLETGDLDSSKYSQRLRFDILVATAEKCDSIMRSKPEWFQDVRVLVLDEIHLIASDRGPVYEVLAAKFTRMFPQIQVLGLSATIGNAVELADWLDASLVESNWRPVHLKEEVVVGRSLDEVTSLVNNSVRDGGQVLVFVNSRRSAESLAEELGGRLKYCGGGLQEVSEGILNALSNPTRQCNRLASCVLNGVAFHHAGLVVKQRSLIDSSFKGGVLKVIVATPTLAAGVNLPSRTVIVRDIKRYTPRGLDYIPVLEYKQQVGRAGRPKYDTHGEAFVFAKDDAEADYVREHYVNGLPEPINSQLGIEPVLRFHVLASVASGFTKTKESILDFFSTTLFGLQYGLSKGFEDTISRVVKELIDWNFLLSEGRFLMPTPTGARVSELYIDPLTGYNYLKLFETAELQKKFPDIGVLEVLCDASEIAHLPVKSAEESALWNEAYSTEDQFFRDLGGFDLDWQFLSRFKTAQMFSDWINETTEDMILEKYGVAPGQLYQRLQMVEWLCYSASELCRLSGFKKSVVALKKVETRVEYGIKEELLPLVSVKGVGRVRARKLFDAGIKTPTQLKAAPLERLSSILGRKTAENVKKS